MSRLTVRGATSQRDINRLFELSNDNQFGKTVFTTREAAEAKLKEMEGAE